MSEKKPNKRLGRGLAALIGDPNPAPTSTPTPTPTPTATSAPKNGVQMVAIDQLQRGAYQPRRAFNQEELDALAASFRQAGILQPLLVRPLAPEGGKQTYEIIAGERRWRAAQIARLHEVPVLIKSFSDVQALEIGLIENIQRTDLNPIEEGEAYARLAAEFHYSPADIAEVVGKSRPHIANTLRLLDAPESIRTYLTQGKLSAGHARALLGHKEAESLAKRVVAQGLSVRATERLAKTQTSTRLTIETKSVDLRALEKQMSDELGLRVTLTPRGDEAGKVEIVYKTLEQFDALQKTLLKRQS